MPAFDTLQLSQDLRKVFTPEQAEALTRAMSQQVGGELATKRDLETLEMSLRLEIKDKVAEAKIDLIKWMVGLMLVNLLGVAGLVITLIKTIPK